jgi:energy-coupling factor transport system ATP-binding protein
VPATGPVVVVENLSYQYPTSPEPVLRDVNLRVEAREFMGVIGPTGAGKTTLCLALNGLVPQFYGGRFFGRAAICGLDTVDHPPNELSRRVGMVFQDPETQLVTTSVENEVAFALENVAVPRAEMVRRIHESLALVRLDGLEKKHPHDLSGGQKQRLAIAAALALQPALLVLDEPTSQLDPVGQEEVFATVARLNQERGLAVLMVSHAVEMLARYARRIVLLADGRVQYSGAPTEVLGQVARLDALGVRAPQVARFYHLMRGRGATVAQTPTTLEDALASYPELRRQVQPQPILDTSASNTPPRPGEPLIDVRDLWHVYPDGTEALRGVRLQVWPGEYVVIVGQNGAGKSTLAKHLVLLLRPSSGEVRLGGEDGRLLSVGKVAQRIGFVSQNPDNQIFMNSVEEEVGFALHARGLATEEVRRRVELALEEMDLLAQRQRHPLSLPKGDRARVVVAAVLAMQPEVLLFDEPTIGQDDAGAQRILEITRRLHQAGKTILVITHHLHLMPAYAERAVVMGQGNIILDAPVRRAFHDLDVLQQSFLFPPQIVQFARALEGREGVPLRALTEEELAAAMRPISAPGAGR